MSKRRASLSDRPVLPSSVPRPTDDLVMGKERMRQEIEEIALRTIMPNRLQPRTQPNSESLHELAESIRQHGVLEPVIVRAIPLTEYEGAGRRYELIAGERRWRASALAERNTIPAIVVSNVDDDRTMLELAITENLQREDLHPLDEAMAFGRMQTELGYSYAQIAERLGKSKGYVQNRLRLLQIDDDLQMLVAERPDTLAHVYEIARLSDSAARAELIVAVRDDALSRAATRARVQTLLHPPQDAPAFEGESYFQKYDREDKHKIDHSANKQTSSASAAHDTSSFLTGRERTMLMAVSEKVEQLLDNPSRVTEEDWAVLSPLALRLSDLLQRIGEKR